MTLALSPKSELWIIKTVKFTCQCIQPAYWCVQVFPLHVGYNVEDTGQPMGDESKGKEHQQESGCSVLW